MKNSDNNIGNRIRDRPVFIAVAQPTAPPRARGTIPISLCMLVQRGTQWQAMLVILFATVCVGPVSPSASHFRRTCCYSLRFEPRCRRLLQYYTNQRAEPTSYNSWNMSMIISIVRQKKRTLLQNKHSRTPLIRMLVTRIGLPFG
jgi:hypothetical protein